MKLADGIPQREITAQFRLWIEEAKSPEEETLEPYLVRHDLPPMKPDRILSINFQSVASAGGLVCITGGPGTGKSNYAAAILSGTLHTVLGENSSLFGAMLYFCQGQPYSFYRLYLHLFIVGK